MNISQSHTDAQSPPIETNLVSFGSRTLLKKVCFTLAMGIVFSSVPSSTLAQTATTTSATTIVSPKSPANLRDAMYQRLAEEEVALTRQFSLLKKLVKTVGPSVAHIEAKKRQHTSAASSDTKRTRRPVVVEEAGSGIVIKYRGAMYVITNYHVIESSEIRDVRVEVDGKIYSPNRLIHDRETDLSVIGLSQTNLIPSRLGDSDLVEIGEFVVAVGSPFGLSHSVSYGIISAMNRHDLDLGPQGVRYQNFMQTDAAINPGNSGGPLINLRGEIIGINTAIASNSGGNDGIGFTIPINMAMRIVSDLIDFGKVQRGFLGVSLDANFSYEKAAQLGLDVGYGAYVSAITSNSPAAESDLRVGDVILEFDGQRVNNDSQLVTKVSLTKLNARVPIKIFRRGEVKSVSVQVRNRNRFEK
ncbi:MAG: trypsin-like peptidase domain-containing protein [Mariniblastus sp.]|nr:trypsin-like peptidase domain-containing protein [Mariniblastus sp.]